MDEAVEGGYRPSPEFLEDTRKPLVELDLRESTELWLMQWPMYQPPDFDGQEVTLKLSDDGLLGSFEGSSGKSYDVVSFSALDPNAAVILSSGSESKIVGRISRRLSIVHYPEPSKPQELKPENLKPMYYNSSATATQSIWTGKTQSGNAYAASSRGSRQKSSSSAAREHSKFSKRRQAGEPSKYVDNSTQYSGRGQSGVSSKSVDNSTQNSGRGHSGVNSRSVDDSTRNSGKGHSGVTTQGSSDRSQGIKSKKRKKVES